MTVTNKIVAMSCHERISLEDLEAIGLFPGNYNKSRKLMLKFIFKEEPLSIPEPNCGGFTGMIEVTGPRAEPKGRRVLLQTLDI